MGLEEDFEHFQNHMVTAKAEDVMRVQKIASEVPGLVDKLGLPWLPIYEVEPAGKWGKPQMVTTNVIGRGVVVAAANWTDTTGPHAVYLCVTDEGELFPYYARANASDFEHKGAIEKQVDKNWPFVIGASLIFRRTGDQFDLETIDPEWFHLSVLDAFEQRLSWKAFMYHRKVETPWAVKVNGDVHWGLGRGTIHG